MGGRRSGALEVMAEQCTGRGARGVVAAAAPMAAAVGAEAMRQGGNAYDGAVAAALAETVLLPPKCGLAGDLIALCLGPGDDAPTALLAIGGAPRRLAETVRARGDLPSTGPLSVGVPGAPAGYAALAARGQLGLGRLVAPAAELAAHGFPWAPICTVLAHESRSLVAAHNPGGTIYFPDGEPIEPGEIVRLPGLATVLGELAVRGARLFDGPVGQAVVDAVRARGGVLEQGDFAFAEAEWAAPGHVSMSAGPELWATPAPTHGPSLLDATEGAAPGDGPAVVLDRVLRAVQRRDAALGDPRGVVAGTSMVSAADAEGRAVVVVHSNSFPRFGSGIVVEGYDLVLANRAGRGFSSVEGHPNFPAPGRRPATTLHAWAAAPPGEPAALLGATPGGVNQMPWNAQALQQVVDGCWDPGLLVTSPRWEWVPATRSVRAEEGLPVADAEPVPAWGLRSAQQVVLRPEPGKAVVAAVDPRTGGAVVAL